MDYINVFLSSTQKDLAEHRDAVYHAINGLEGHHCVRMEEFGARDSPPRDLCVRKVKQCDCFVCLVGLLYGSCPEDESISYTEIEYDTAVNEHKPIIACVCPAGFQLPGDLRETDELQSKQMSFRARVQRERTRVRFNSPDQAALGVTQALYNFRMSESAPTPEQPSEAAVAKEHSAPPQALDAEVSSTTDAPSCQRLEVLEGITSALVQGEVDFAGKDSESVGTFHSARLLLLAKTLFSRKCAMEYLSPHEMNALYTHRDRLQPGGWERKLLWQSLFDNGSVVVPGWYWFRDIGRDGVEPWLWYVALSDDSAEMRVRAIKLLDKAGVMPDNELSGKEDVLSLIASDGPAEVHKALLDYLGAHGNQVHLTIVDRLLADGAPEIGDAGSRARWQIKVRSDPGGAYEELLSLEGPPPGAISAFSGKETMLPTEALTQGTAHRNAKIRALAVRALVARKELSKDTAYALLRDTSLYVRAACYEHLIASKHRFTSTEIRDALTTPDSGESGLRLLYPSGPGNAEIEQILYGLYQTFGYDDLLKEINWISPDGAIAYRVMAEHHFDKAADRIRGDLADSFQSLRQEWVDHIKADVTDKLRKAFGAKMAIPEVNKKVQPLLDQSLTERLGTEEIVQEFTRGKYIASALAGLALHGQRDDLAVARRYLAERRSHYFGAVQEKAARVIARFGDESDVPELVSAANELNGDTQEAILNVALGFSPGPQGVAPELLEEDNTTIFRISIEALLRNDTIDAKELIKGYLHDGHDFKRVMATRYLVKKCSREELVELLKNYESGGSYYYNVVCWLDRCLYAPEPLKRAYMDELCAGGSGVSP